VLHNFLGTYTSRYSEYNGYWLFGFLVGDLEDVQFDLLTEVASCDGVVEVARNLAVGRFAEQLCKAGLDPSLVREVSLQIERLDGQVKGRVNGNECGGFKIRFRASAGTDTGKLFECERVLFVAPHNADIELRSARAQTD
jgi:hypothetical protein